MLKKIDPYRGIEWLEIERGSESIKLKIPRICCYAEGLDCGLCLFTAEVESDNLFLLDTWRLRPQSGAVDISGPIENWRREYGVSHAYFPKSDSTSALAGLIRATARASTSSMAFEPYSGLIKLAELQKSNKLDTAMFKGWDRLLERIKRLDCRSPDPGSDVMAVLMAAETIKPNRIRMVPKLSSVIWSR